jgi:protoporphyrinogen oxidase
VFEKESTVGGLCRSFRQDGFTFDCTGHLIHLKNAYTRELIDRLLPGRLTPHERFASIYSKGCVTPYPFQANTYGLPLEVVKECLVGFVESMQQNGGEARDFHDWTLKTFGDGIAKHFMLPYNEKFWKRDLREITADWVSWSIPKPKLEEVVNGALGLTNRGMGYNPKFLYPGDGGIECLPNALAAPLRTIHTGHTLERIDIAKKAVRFSNGREETYDALISTIPLPLVYKLADGAPDDLRAAAEELSVLSVLNFNVGIARPGISDQHWLYFPENDFIFSRAGFPANFSKSVAPEGTSSIYIEITHRQGERPNLEEALERSLEGLRQCGVLRNDDRILTVHMLDLTYAYIVFDRARERHLKTLIGYLEANAIFPAGRYGRWDYYSMEDSILSGKAAAESVFAASGAAGR